MSAKSVTTLCWTLPLLFCVFVVIHLCVGLPQFRYLPETREFMWSKPDGIISMGWYGRAVGSALMALLIGGMLHLGLRGRLQRTGPWIAAVGIAILCLIVAYHHVAHWIFQH